MVSRGKKLYYIALLAFALCSIIPLLIFIYILVDRKVLDYPLAALCVLMGLVLAILGYFFLKGAFDVLSRVAKSLAMRAEEGADGEEFAREFQGKVFEADAIMEAFQKTVERLEASVDRVDRLSNDFVVMGELLQIASCSLEPNEMITSFLRRIIHVSAAEYGVVSCMEGEDELKMMVALPHSDFSPGFREQIHFNTYRVLKTKNPYLGSNFSSKRGSPGNGELGPVISWPVSIRGEVSAVLHLGRSFGSPAFSQEQFKTLRPVSSLLGLALDNLRRLRASRFFSVPVAEHKPGALIDHPGERPLLTRCILVVDDEPVVRNVIGNFLSGKGYRVVAASSGQEAITRLKEERPECMLLDLSLKDMDGLEVLKWVQREIPEVSVVVITGLKDDETFRKAISLGALDYLVKPIDFTYLENVLLVRTSSPGKPS